MSSTCVPVGAVGAPCASDDECEGSVCRDFDFSGDFRCVVDECEAGCGEGLVCCDVEACGRTCVAPAEEGASCGSNLIKEVCNLDHPCAAGLECVVTFEIFDGTTSDCAVPGVLGEPCAGLVNAFDSGDDPATDGCVDGLRCTADGLCADEDALRDAGDDCDDAAQCVSGQCFQGSCT